MTKQDYAPKGYPFSLGIRLTYLLDDNGLTVKSDVTNTGDTPAPFGLGFHPYFTVGTDTVNDIAMQIKAKSLVEFDDILKPTGKFIDVSLTNFDFNHQKKIDDLVIDNAFSALIFTNGKNQTIISNNKNRQITIWQDESFPYLQIFSADTLSEPHRRKIFAVEPYTCTGFALNVPDMGLKVLQPKELFSGKWGVIPSVL
ncbi:MAG: Aldose 1-epimerase [bacterium ADurb.Bin400]|nr:MAG: Aldose 1-epimerase [bacterium ADurb.Bin400]